MPKELIHFEIAERTARLLADTPFASSLAQNSDGMLLGSVFHDVLFYAVTPNALPLEKLAHRLHGSEDQDTFTLIRLQARQAASTPDSLPAAILVGMVSHLFADAVMHPLVWHLTGDYYDNNPVSKSLARQRHRALESMMDMAACPEKIGRARYRLHTLLRRCPSMLTEGLPVAAIGDLAFMQPGATQKHLTTAWRIFATLQWTYSISPLARSLYALRPLLPRAVAEVAMLYYAPQFLRQADRLQGPIAYRHPVTGESQTATLDELMDEAANQAASFCRAIAPAVFDGKPIDLPKPGPSMESGLDEGRTDAMRHFADPPFPDLA